MACPEAADLVCSTAMLDAVIHRGKAFFTDARCGSQLFPMLKKRRRHGVPDNLPEQFKHVSFKIGALFFVSFEKIWTGHCGADLNVSAQIVLLKEQMYLQETH